jgi:protein-tyrosine phosphatase
MVCLGNICRSPLAEGILKQKCAQQKLEWTIDSAGTGKWSMDAAPDTRSIRIANENGFDISAQRSRTVNSEDYEKYDLLFAMDISVYKTLMGWALDKEEENKIKLIMDEVHPGENISIPDPYWNDLGFVEVYDMLNKACDRIIERYSKHQLN